MVKKNKIVCFAKIWKSPRQEFGFFEDWRKFGKILKLGVALILRYVLTYLLLTQTKFALARPGPKSWFPLLRKFYVRTGVNLTGFNARKAS